MKNTISMTPSTIFALNLYLWLGAAVISGVEVSGIRAVVGATHQVAAAVGVPVAVTLVLTTAVVVVSVVVACAEVVVSN